VADVLSPDWWVERLYAGIVARQTGISFYDAYYRGDHPLPWLAPQARAEFRRILRMTRSNYMGLVVDAMTERLQVEGFRLAEAEQGDAETWRIWQANNLDSDSDQGILEAAICGQSYLLVAPNADDPATPNMWVEHPSQAIVEFEPGTSRRTRAAGLKVWDDDWTGELHATLYLPDGLYKFRSDRPAQGSGGRPRWEVRPVPGEDWPAAKREDVKDIASRTRTPAQYLLGEMANVSGDALKSAESGLVSKVRQRQRTYAEGFEQAMRLARRAAGLPDAGARGMETIWRNPEFRTEGELTDAVVKRLQTGIASLRQAREDVGYSAAQIARLEAEDAAAAVDPTLAAVARTLTQPATATTTGVV
jgi:hypothetical protein